MDFSFYMPVKVIGGSNAVKNHSEVFSSLGKRCLIVTGHHSAVACGALQDVADALTKEEIAFEVFDDIGPNPLLRACRCGAQKAREFQADFVIGIGGGSPLDASKAIALLAANPEISSDDFFAQNWINSSLPTVLVGTTSGTGSEVSSVAVLTLENGRKRAVKGLHGTIAFADSRYTHSLSREQTISTALDALAHAAEGYLSPKCDEISGMCALKAVPVLWKHLSALHDGAELTPKMHDELYEASLWAGMTLNTVGTAFPHPFGYILTEDFGIPHGRACTTFLPALFNHTAQSAPEKVNALLTAMGCDKMKFYDVIRTLSNTDHIHMTRDQVRRFCLRFENLGNYANVTGGYDAEQAACLFFVLFCC